MTPTKKEKIGTTFAAVSKLARTLPGVEESMSYGTLALKVKGKFLARLREDGTTMVIKVPFMVRDHLMSTQPSVFFNEEHYRNYPTVLIRLAAAKPSQVQELIEDGWRQLAPKRVVAAHLKVAGASPADAVKPSPRSHRRVSPTTRRGGSNVG